MNLSDPPDFAGGNDSDSQFPTAQASLNASNGGDFIPPSRLSIRATNESSTASAFSSQALLLNYGHAGRIKLKFETGFSYTWSNLRVEIHKRVPFWRKPAPEESGAKIILDDVSGCAHSGELWALMGSSGAGKTTLLNALNFRPAAPHAKVSGKRCLNGTPLSREIISSISAYVEQDDLMIPRMTVLEHLNFQAKLRFPSLVSWATRQKRVEEVLKELGLWQVRQNYIGSASTVKGISGGEMKRLAFASEILTDPNILFCDEPTSGLDSFMAKTVVDVMRDMAARGKLIICTIHQPSSEIFALFDNLYLLAGGGVVYSGPREDAPKYFATLGYHCPATHNPADFLIRALSINPDTLAECEERVEKFKGSFKASELHDSLMEETSKTNEMGDREIHMLGEQSRSKCRASFIAQTCAVSWRTWMMFLRDPALLNFRGIQIIACSILPGLVLYKMGHMPSVQGAVTVSGVVYLYALTVLMVPAYISVSLVSPTMELVKRENWKGLYRSSAYFLGLMSMDVPVFIIYPWLGFPAMWWLASLQGPIQRLIRECLLLSIVSQTGVAFGYLATCVSNGVKMSLILVTSMVVPGVIFSSVLADTEGLFWPMRWIKYLCILEYTAANLLIEQWSDVTDIYFTEPFVPELFGDGPGVLDYYGLKKDHYWFNVITSIVIAILLRLVAYIGVRLKCAHS